MVEAVVEDAGVKQDIFRRADESLRARGRARLQHLVDPDRVTRRGDRPARPGDRHALLQPGARDERLSRSIRAPQHLRRDRRGEILELSRELGKTPAQANDFPGFVSNRILMPLINEAAYALADGVAEAEAIDTIARLGFNHPIGPLALADLIGLDTCVSIMEVLREGLGDEKYEPCPLLREHVAAGRLGRKTGQGFHVTG